MPIDPRQRMQAMQGMSGVPQASADTVGEIGNGMNMQPEGVGFGGSAVRKAGSQAARALAPKLRNIIQGVRQVYDSHGIRAAMEFALESARGNRKAAETVMKAAKIPTTEAVDLTQTAAQRMPRGTVLPQEGARQAMPPQSLPKR